MIIETPYKQNDTVTMKTTAGEEVVARFVEEDTNGITVQKPMTLMATQGGVGLAPWCITTHPDAKLKINKSAVLFIHKTDGEMAKQYVAGSTGIQMA